MTTIHLTGEELGLEKRMKMYLNEIIKSSRV